MPDAAPDRSERHIVDTLIEERAPKLSATRIWPALRPVLDALLNYREARDLADTIAPMGGGEALERVSRRLELKVAVEGVAQVPERGRCIVVANHPTGIADGIAMFDALRPRRPDLCFFANADAHRVCPGFEENLVPVVWPPEQRTIQSSKQTLRLATAALEDERAVVVFPAGGVARFRMGRVCDLPWEATPFSLARKHGAPLVPAHMAGPLPWLFHLFDRLSHELRDVALFHELLNKRGKRYAVTFGPPIAPERSPEDEAAVAALKTHVERTLRDDPNARFA